MLFLVLIYFVFADSINNIKVDKSQPLNITSDKVKIIRNKNEIIFPKETATGGLCHYISDESIKDFQPMNVTFGIIAPSDKRFRKKREKNAYISARAIEKFKEILTET